MFHHSSSNNPARIVIPITSHDIPLNDNDSRAEPQAHFLLLRLNCPFDAAKSLEGRGS
jgi:hypothetical protein